MIAETYFQMSGKLVISRKNEYINRMRSYNILIDGQPVGTIDADEDKEYEVSADSHTVECKINWFQSNRYTTGNMNGDTVHLQVNGNRIAFRAMTFVLSAYAFGMFVLNDSLKRMGESGEWIIRAMYLVPILYLVYSFTIDRRQYLKIKKDHSNVLAL